MKKSSGLSGHFCYYVKSKLYYIYYNSISFILFFFEGRKWIIPQALGHHVTYIDVVDQKRKHHFNITFRVLVCTNRMVFNKIVFLMTNDKVCKWTRSLLLKKQISMMFSINIRFTPLLKDIAAQYSWRSSFTSVNI